MYENVIEVRSWECGIYDNCFFNLVIEIKLCLFEVFLLGFC